MKLREMVSVFWLFFVLLVSCVIVSETVSAVSEGGWGTKAPLPQVILGKGGAIVVDGKIYVVGGSATYMYDPASNVWTAKAPMPTPRFYFGIAAYKNKIYTIGGSAWVNGTEKSYSVNEVYDPASDTWQTKQPVSTSRYDLAAGVVNGKIYLIGGSTGIIQNPGTPPNMGTVYMNEVYDVANDSWTAKAPDPLAVQGSSSAVCDGKIYILGQFSTEIYDPANDTWTRGAANPGQVVYSAAAATTGIDAPKQICVFGGATYEMGLKGSSLTQVYFPQNNSWSYGASMPTAREYLTAADVNDTIYVIGGSKGLSLPAVTSNEVYWPIGYGTPDPSYVPETFQPAVSLLSPNAAYNVSNVPLMFTADKALDWAGYSLDGAKNITVTGNSTITNLFDGRHNVTVYANDTDGNMVSSQTAVFNVTLPPAPFPTAPVAAVLIASVAIACMGAAVYYRKKKPAIV